MSRIPLPLRRAVQERARGLCEYCHSQMDVTGHEFPVDHILPKMLGGTDEIDNLCCSCSGCNTYKQARVQATDPRTGRVVPLFHPRRDRWDAHFRWSPTATRVMGRTAIGRATIEALRLNRPRLVRSRRIWAAYGLHPPHRRPVQGG
jgi:HNH endonuclease